MQTVSENRPDEQGHNGWTNYETWSVALIINNDQGTQEQAFDVVRGCMAEHEARTGYGAELDGSVAHYLKDWIETEAEVVTGMLSDLRPLSYLWSQLLTAALSEVDWFDLARTFIRDVEEQDSYNA